jgi:hypothetical protein
VALKTGYVKPYSDTDKRSQVIVVLFEDWSVICYDSSLHILWSKEVAHKTFDLEHWIKYFRLSHAAIYIAPLALTDESSEGVVIVGGAMSRRNTLDGVSITSEDIQLRRLSDGTIADADALAKLAHFSLFALDSFSGHVLWKHDGMEVKAEQFSRSLPQHAYTLDLKVRWEVLFLHLHR